MVAGGSTVAFGHRATVQPFEMLANTLTVTACLLKNPTPSDSDPEFADSEPGIRFQKNSTTALTRTQMPN